MVDYTGLENRRAERHRGFESLSLRKKKTAENSAVFFCSQFLSPNNGAAWGVEGTTINNHGHGNDVCDGAWQ